MFHINFRKDMVCFSFSILISFQKNCNLLPNKIISFLELLELFISIFNFVNNKYKAYNNILICYLKNTLISWHGKRYVCKCIKNLFIASSIALFLWPAMLGMMLIKFLCLSILKWIYSFEYY